MDCRWEESETVGSDVTKESTRLTLFPIKRQPSIADSTKLLRNWVPFDTIRLLIPNLPTSGL